LLIDQVPPVVLLLAKSPVVDKYDLSSLRMLNSGAAPLTGELVDAMYSRLKIPIKQGYGLSETSPTTHTQTWEDWNKTIGSVGTLLPNQEAKYMSPDEKEVPVGETGEFWIKGPNIFLGYLNNEEGTKNALTEDGYFKTGDVGFQDTNGNFFITDRVKELIKYKGFQVPPAELEGLLMSHSDIDDCAVIGIYDESQATEIPRAYVVPREGVEGSPATEKAIMGWLSKKVASHKKLRGGVRFVDEIPKSPSGKILRRVLKVQAKEEEDKGQKAKL
jgi:4-coumarate--CoA ligase